MSHCRRLLQVVIILVSLLQISLSPVALGGQTRAASQRTRQSIASGADQKIAYAETTDLPPLAFNDGLIGQIGGPTDAVAVQGDYAYIGIGPRLVILDISNPTQPIVVGQTSVGGDPNTIAVGNNTAYIASGSNILHIVDVSNPAAPTEVGFYNTPGRADDVALAGNYAYVADADVGLLIIDVSNPVAPTEVGYYDTPGWVSDVAVAGSYAYVADSYTGLRIIDVSIPATPTEVGFYDAPGWVSDVAVAGSYAYVAGESALRIIDVSTPAAPAEAGSYDTLEWAIGVFVSGNYAYVADRSAGLRIINVTNPAAPTEVGFFGVLGYPTDVAVEGNIAYVTDEWRGLRIIDVANPVSPTVIGFYDTPGSAEGVAVANDYAYVTVDGILRIINVGDPAAPVEVGFYDGSGWLRDVAVSGNYAYVVDGLAGLRIINISSPATPTEVGLYDMLEYAAAIAVAGNHAYVTDAEGDLHIINVSNPAAPSGVGFYDTPERPDDVAVAGNYVYVADDGGLHILNVANPATPTEVGRYNSTGYLFRVVVAGDYAYLSGCTSLEGEYNIRVVNVSNPAAPVEGSFYGVPSAISAVAVNNNYIYGVGAAAGLLILRSVPIVGEARADVGMPYGFDRGCPSPYAPCGGPYQGFYQGVGTDLAVDAYRVGADFNLHSALALDAAANPGRYRWDTARSADDLRHYFANRQLLLPHDQPYHAGDLAFLDWNNDAVTEHVVLISAIDADGHPLRMVDATDVALDHLSKRAWEHSWSDYYDQHAQGHGRLNSLATQPTAQTAAQTLYITTTSPGVTLRLRDGNGKVAAVGYNENWIASNNADYIPYIPRGKFAASGAQQVISVTYPLSNTAQYFVEVIGQVTTPYQVNVQTRHNGMVTAETAISQSLALSETHRIALVLSAPGGTLTFTATAPVSIPTLTRSPGEIQLGGVAGTQAMTIFTLTETSQLHAVTAATATVSTLMSQNGQIVTGTLFTITPTIISLSPGGRQTVQVGIDLTNLPIGTYRGSLTLASPDFGKRPIPMTLSLTPRYSLFFPFLDK